MNATIEVPSGGSYFEGHFPGRPILPGVAEIALVLDALADEARRPVAIRGIVFARLRQVVLPGDRLELVASEQGETRLRFDLKRKGVLVANGEFDLGKPETGGEKKARWKSAVQGDNVFRLDELLPHRPPMQFLTSFLEQTADSLICSARIPRACALVSGGSAPAVAAIEAAAQAAAAWEALGRWRTTGVASPRLGYLVAMRDIAFSTERIPADCDLLVSVSMEAAAPPLAHYRIEVVLEGIPLTRGTIATFLADDGA